MIDAEKTIVYDVDPSDPWDEIYDPFTDVTHRKPESAPKEEAPTLNIPFAVKLTGETYTKLQAALGLARSSLEKQSVNINMDYSIAVGANQIELATYWLTELHSVHNALEKVKTAHNALSRSETISPEAK